MPIDPVEAVKPPGALVAVVGSLNLDLIIEVPRHPVPGETILGGDALRGPGGKGANQAVAVARLGVPTTMVGRVGDDEAGRTLTSALRAAGVGTTHVRVMPGGCGDSARRAAGATYPCRGRGPAG
jgi:ribokinase